MYTTKEEPVITYLKLFRRTKGIYIIKVKRGRESILKEICENTIGLSYRSNIAYVGKADYLKTTDLFRRAKQEMGWSNFVGATFMNKIGNYLGFSTEDRKNKKAIVQTREFIIDNFDISCEILPEGKDLLKWETEKINQLQASLNTKKII